MGATWRHDEKGMHAFGIARYHRVHGQSRTRHARCMSRLSRRRDSFRWYSSTSRVLERISNVQCVHGIGPHVLIGIPVLNRVALSQIRHGIRQWVRGC
jgi:hypothetical protein